METERSVKFFFNDEIRRFPLEQGRANYDGLLEKLATLFPGFQLGLSWKDEEGDQISICNDADFQEAVKAAKSGIIKIYGTRKAGVGHVMLQRRHGPPGFTLRSFPGLNLPPMAPPQPTEPVVTPNKTAEDNAMDTGKAAEEATDASEKVDPKLHRGVTCDGCNGSVTGRRYKCLVCADYDLCEACEAAKRHDSHPMVRISDPKDHTWRKAFFMGRMAGGPGGCPFRGGSWRGGHPHGPRRPSPPDMPSFGRPPSPPAASNDMPPPPPPHPHHHHHHGQHPHHPPPPKITPETWAGWANLFRMPPQQQQNGTAATAPDAAGSAESPQQAQNPQQFLRTVGEHVAAVLSNFGIDVDVDVENRNGTREKVGLNNKPAAEPTSQNATAAATTPSAPPAAAATTEMETTESQQQPILIDAAPISQPAQQQTEQQWTFLEPEVVSYPNLSSVNATATAASATPSDAKLEECLVLMMNMGFSNEDGWLTRLVQSKNGDLNAVLDTLNPGSKRH